MGSDIYLADKWDSGIIESELTSCYFGGGNVLQGGQEYWVNIQTYSAKNGWGDTNSSKFVMIK